MAQQLSKDALRMLRDEASHRQGLVLSEIVCNYDEIVDEVYFNEAEVPADSEAVYLKVDGSPVAMCTMSDRHADARLVIADPPEWS